MEREKMAWGIFRIGGVLIFSWYLLLLYCFPNSIYGLDFGLEFYLTVSIVSFITVTGGLASYSLRIARLLRYQNKTTDKITCTDADLFQAVESHFLLHIRLLFLFSVWVYWLSMAQSLTDEFDMIPSFLISGLSFLVIMNAILEKLIPNTRDLLTPRRSIFGWVGASVLSIGMLAAIVNILTDIARTVAMAKVFFTPFLLIFQTAAGREPHGDLFSATGSVFFMVAAYLFIMGYSGWKVYKQWQNMKEDVSRLYRWVRIRLGRDKPQANDET